MADFIAIDRDVLVEWLLEAKECDALIDDYVDRVKKMPALTKDLVQVYPGRTEWVQRWVTNWESTRE